MPVLSKAAILGSFAALAAGQSSITVDLGTQYQRIDGFGFSQAFGRAAEFQAASSSTQKAALDYLFSTETGAGFSIIRNRIGSGGSGDSIEPNNPGSPSATPNYVWDGNDSGQFWFTQQAVSYGVSTIYADAWSAPGFMKTNGNEATAGYLCGSTGHTCSSGDWQQAYANFLVEYCQLYADHGITITHLGFLNEPDFSPGYSQMQISSNAQEAISFIPILDATVQASGLNLQLTCCDAVGWTMQSTYTTALVNAGATSHLDVITAHSYSADATSPLSQTSLPKWNTEGGPSSAFTTTWYASGADNEGFFWANKLAVAMVNAQLSAYLFWEGFEIQQQQSASHLVDALDGSTPTPSGIFWAFAMWSRHLRPGAHRVAVSGSVPSTIIGAFENADGSVVVVFTNSGSSAQSASVAFEEFTPGAAQAWVTDASNTFSATDASLSGGSVTVSVPAHGVVTLKLTEGSGSGSGDDDDGGSPTTAPSTPTTTTVAASPSSTGACAALYAQCGGAGWAGETCCSSGSCTYSNDYYSQCL
ncbi:carbohydrate-binding module family 1 protein [Xylariomycetidae sp. FL0641]|nr:carbohydrate-binding module family 1 protein [Xylariomycetidae sp. FL0641]